MHEKLKFLLKSLDVRKTNENTLGHLCLLTTNAIANVRIVLLKGVKLLKFSTNSSKEEMKSFVVTEHLFLTFSAKNHFG